MALLLKWHKICVLVSALNFSYADSFIDAEGYRNYCDGYSVKLYCKSLTQKYKLVIEDVIYGSVYDQCGWNLEETCTVSNTTEVINSACAGKASCTIKVASESLGDDCGTENNTLRIKISCIKTSKSENIVLDGWWGSWSHWSSCDVTCNGGTKYRSRSCDDPAPANGGNDCRGNSTSSEICNSNPCKATTSGSENQCCWCVGQPPRQNVTDEELKIRKEKIESTLYIDKEKLSSTLRKKISAHDNRTSSVAIGTVAVAFLTIVTSCIIGLDVERFLCRNKFLRGKKYEINI